MTTYRLMDGASGRPGVGSSGTQPPSAGTSYSGAYITGLAFEVTSWALWFQGYYWWVPSTVSQTTTGQKFALWQVTGAGAGTLVPGSTVTAGTLTAGAWNYVPLATPLALSADISYNAATGYTSTSGFPKTANQFGSGNTYSAGITNGPLQAYSSTSGSNTVGGASWLPQQPYSVAGTDPGAIMPSVNDNDDLLWIDVLVSDQAPAGASYRAFPNMPVTSLAGGGPQSSAYTLGMEFSVSASCKLSKIWHYSAPTSAVLPTRCGIWTVASTTELAGSDNSSPSWLLPSGSAASAGAGWVYCDYSSAGVTLAASTNYKVSTFTSDNTHIWFGTTTSYWSTGPGASGITTGPLTLPNNAGASPGQNSWHQSATWTYPATSSSPENDWIDVEVIPVASSGSATVTVTASRTAAATRTRHRGQALTVTASRTAVAGATRHRTASRPVTATITATAKVIRPRSVSRPAVATITATAAKLGAHTGSATRAETVTVTVTANATHVRGASRTVTATVTATPTKHPKHLVTASRTTTATITAAATNEIRRRTAILAVTVQVNATAVNATAPAPLPQRQGSWWQLLDILAFREQEFEFYADRPPVACPNDGEPLRLAPPTDSASGVELYCPYDGWQYPRDWIRPQRL